MIAKDSNYLNFRRNRIYIVFREGVGKFSYPQTKCGSKETAILQSDGANKSGRNAYSNYSTNTLSDKPRYNVF